MERQIINIGTIDYKANQVVPLELNPPYPFAKLQFRLKAVVSVATGSGETTGTKVPLSPATLLQRVELRGTDGRRSQNIKTLTGVDMLLHSKYISQGVQENVNGVAESAASTTASYTLYGSYDMWFKMPDLAGFAYKLQHSGSFDNNGKAIRVPILFNPQIATIFDPKKYSSLQLNILWGDVNSIMTGFTAGKVTLDSAEVQVVAEYVPNANVFMDDFLVPRESIAEKVVSGASTNFDIPIPLGNRLPRIYIHAIKDSLYNNSLINNVTCIINENVTKTDAGFNQLRNENSKSFRIPFADLADGVAVLDFDMNKDLQGYLDLSAADIRSAKLVLDVNAPTGTTKIRCVWLEITE